MDDSTPDADGSTDANTDTEDPAADEADVEETDADWMEPADKRILEFMESEDAFEPVQFDDEGICPAKYAAYRCREMTAYGLLNRPMPGMYMLTDAGEEYLAGELDPSDLERDE
ncbi:hypothetical protein [Natrinema salaciae]|uniref:Uncharacterized protein n=1 Tax=Natrinema salaciae TaxID=1186196 RepID=A0A1H9SIE6_9EURY|nr:hypothetical protein [Natrinema salaciae]SER84019.1 hypothetical protein SAMN04489841_4718 [Natrinema salaciae]